MKARPTFVAGAVALTLLLAAPAMAAPGGSSSTSPGASRADEVASYWTPARQAAAIPRDLALDAQGRGFIRSSQGWQPYGGSRAPQDPKLTEATVGAEVFAQQPMAGDTTKPSVTQLTPAKDATIGSSATFSADVADSGGVKSVQVVITFPSGTTRAYSLARTAGTTTAGTYSKTLSGFSNGTWYWHIVAKDASNNTTNTSTTPGKWKFTVDTSGGTGGGTGGTGTDVADASWTGGGNVQMAAGRIMFSMPSKGTQWGDYVCSGTAVTDTATNTSIILTAAHCVYDDANKVFAKNVLFIPNQSNTNATGSDRTCSNDPIGCWAPTHGVVDVKYTQTTFPNNSPWDYAYYVVPTLGAHSTGFSTAPDSLEDAVPALVINFAQPVTGQVAQAMGYSYSQDPKFRYCTQALGTESAGDWWLSQCGLSGGASGGPWLQGSNPVSGNDPIISVNSWGYTTGPGMAGPPLWNNSAKCVYDKAVGSSAPATGNGFTVTC